MGRRRRAGGLPGRGGRGSLIALAVLISVALAPASTGHANTIARTAWGGTEFSESDREVQAAGDTPGLAVDPTGRWVATLGLVGGASFAYRFDANGHQVARFAVASATAIALDAGSGVYTGSASGQVRRYGPRGALVGAFSTGAAITALAVDRAGDIYVASGNALRRYSIAGAPATVFGRPGDIGTAAAIALDGRGGVLVADPPKRRVEEFGADGRLVRALGSPDAAGGALFKPTAVGTDASGNVFVGDGGGQGFDIKLFNAGGSYQGIIDNGFFDPVSHPFQPVLLAVSPQGNVYFTPYDPDVDLIPAPIVPAPRFRIVDRSRAGGDDDRAAVPVSVGRTHVLSIDVLPSLSSHLQASIGLAPGLVLPPGAASPRRVDLSPGAAATSVSWPVGVSSSGRHVALVAVAGAGPSGQPTRLVKQLPIYGIRGPALTVLDALYLRRARQVLVAVRLGLGTRLAGPDRFGLADSLDNVPLSISATSGGRRLRSLDLRIGQVAAGTCQPFALPRGRGGLAALRVRARYAGTADLRAASADRIVRPSSHPHSAVLRGCLRSYGLAGGPAR